MEELISHPFMTKIEIASLCSEVLVGKTVELLMVLKFSTSDLRDGLN